MILGSRLMTIHLFLADAVIVDDAEVEVNDSSANSDFEIGAGANSAEIRDVSELGMDDAEAICHPGVQARPTRISGKQC